MRRDLRSSGGAPTMSITLVFTLSFSLPFVLEAALADDGDLDSELLLRRQGRPGTGRGPRPRSRGRRDEGRFGPGRRRGLRFGDFDFGVVRYLPMALSIPASETTGWHGSGSTSAALSPTPWTTSSRCPTARRCWPVPWRPQPSTFRAHRAADGRRRVSIRISASAARSSSTCLGHEHETCRSAALCGKPTAGSSSSDGDARERASPGAVFPAALDEDGVPDLSFSATAGRCSIVRMPVSSPATRWRSTTPDESTSARTRSPPTTFGRFTCASAPLGSSKSWRWWISAKSGSSPISRSTRSAARSCSRCATSTSELARRRSSCDSICRNLDADFGGDGIADLTLEEGSWMSALALQSDARSRSPGTSTPRQPAGRFLLARLLADGSRDASFDGNGVALRVRPRSRRSRRSFRPGSAGRRLVAVGTRHRTGSDRAFAVLRTQSTLIFTDGFERGSAAAWLGN